LLERAVEKLYDAFTYTSAVVCISITALMFALLITESTPSIKKFGLSFLLSTSWDPYRGVFGGGVFIFGSFLTAFLALLVSLPIAVGVALFISEYTPRALKPVFSSLIELLAGVPSVVYGLWGLMWLAPLMRSYIQPWIIKHLGFIPFLRGEPIGVGVLTTSLVLALMILPIMSVITYESMELVPNEIREGAYALGASKGDVCILIVKSSSRSLIAGCVLGLGRAFGETMVTAMLIGGSYTLPRSLLDPAYTIASLIVHEFRYAYAEALYRSALTELALITLIISVFTSLLGRKIAAKAVGYR